MRRTRLARALYSGVHALLSSAWRLSLIGKQTELEVISSLALLQKSNFFLCEEKFVCKKKGPPNCALPHTRCYESVCAALSQKSNPHPLAWHSGWRRAATTMSWVVCQMTLAYYFTLAIVLHKSTTQKLTALPSKWEHWGAECAFEGSQGHT